MICAGMCLVTLVGIVLAVGVQTAALPVLPGAHPSSQGIPIPAPTDSPSPTPLPTALPALEANAPAMAAALAAVEPSPRDPIELAITLRGVSPQDISAPGSAAPMPYTVGDTAQFWVTNNDSRESRLIEAELVAATEHVAMWVDTSTPARLPNGQPAAPADFLAAAERFEESYRILREVFGEEPSPGVDGDVRLYVLNSGNLGAVGGYFSADDQFVTAVNPTSNAHEMFYVSPWGAGGVNGSYYNKTLAHEFQHMIHYALDPNEETWLNEGMSELSQQLVGLSGMDWVSTYLYQTGIQLTTWPPLDDTSAYYGGNFLLAEYLYEQFGEDFIVDLVRDSRNGLPSLDAALADAGYAGDSDDVLDDWSVAILLDDPALADGRYGFQNIDVEGPTAAAVVMASSTYDGLVSQYGFDYVRLYDEGTMQIAFEGSRTTAIVPTAPYSGDWMWWSNMGDYSMMTLTREFDLTGVEQATLTFWTWYSIELEWDYAYVMASTDGGQTWELLETPFSADADPTGNNYGDGITGESEAWIQMMVDLSDYAGQPILLRFALITDDSSYLEGMVIDDIAIPEIGFFDDGENGDDGWVADGFVRIQNVLPQRWSVQAVTLGNPSEVIEMALDENNAGSLTLTIPTNSGGVILIVSPRTRNTLMPASYHLDVTR